MIFRHVYKRVVIGLAMAIVVRVADITIGTGRHWHSHPLGENR